MRTVVSAHCAAARCAAWSRLPPVPSTGWQCMATAEFVGSFHCLARQRALHSCCSRRPPSPCTTLSVRANGAFTRTAPWDRVRTVSGRHWVQRAQVRHGSVDTDGVYALRMPYAFRVLMRALSRLQLWHALATCCWPPAPPGQRTLGATSTRPTTAPYAPLPRAGSGGCFCARGGNRPAHSRKRGGGQGRRRWRAAAAAGHRGGYSSHFIAVLSHS